MALVRLVWSGQLAFSAPMVVDLMVVLYRTIERKDLRVATFKYTIMLSFSIETMSPPVLSSQFPHTQECLPFAISYDILVKLRSL